MCLAIPAKVIRIDSSRDEAVVDLHGSEIPISTVLVPDIEVGEWVLLHAGFALQRLEAEELEQDWAVLNDVARAAESVGSGHG